jgi:hypothetical protein
MASSPSPTSVAGRAAAEAEATWARLATSTGAVEPNKFDPSLTGSLPEPARRWLGHTIKPGTSLARAVVLEMEGRIRIGRWLPFRAVQLHAPPDGYVWAARATLGPLSISGFDRYTDGSGEMRWRLGGRIPVMTAAGPDIDRSAQGRLALDAIFVPTTFLSQPITWRLGTVPDTVIAEWSIAGRSLRPELRVGPDGALRSIVMPRWANPDKQPWSEYPCGGTLEDEVDFNGIKLPTTMRVGYFFGTDRWAQGEFFRATITNASFL